MLAASAPGTMSRTTAREITIPAVTTDCTMRKNRNQPADGASRVPTVASRKTASAPSIAGRRPHRSLTGPASSCRTALIAR